MVLGALIDAGLPTAELRAALGSLAIDGTSISAEKVLRAGVSATKFTVQERAGAHRNAPEGSHHHHHEGAGHHDHAHTHTHAHDASEVALEHDHPHRSLNEIYALIDRS